MKPTPYGLPTPCELHAALTKIRTAGYNWDATSQWMQKVAANALEPGKWPDPGEQPATAQPCDHKWQCSDTGWVYCTACGKQAAQSR